MYAYAKNNNYFKVKFSFNSNGLFPSCRREASNEPSLNAIMLVAAPQKSVFNVYNYCCYDPPDCYCCCCVVVFRFVFIAFVRCVNLKPT